MMVNNNLVGGLKPSEKYESQLGRIFQFFLWNIKHVPNRQAVSLGGSSHEESSLVKNHGN